MNPILQSILLALLGGTNIITFASYWTERKKRIHQAEITRHEAEIKEGDALSSMRTQYAIFVQDIAEQKEMLKQDFQIQKASFEREMQLMRTTKENLKTDYKELKKYSDSLSRKLDRINLKCTNNCHVDEK